MKRRNQTLSFSLVLLALATASVNASALPRSGYWPQEEPLQVPSLKREVLTTSPELFQLKI
jgi:hypothetical protein